MSSSLHSYALYHGPTGPTPHWQFRGKPRVQGCYADGYGGWEPPAPAWLVRASSITQACFYARHSVLSIDQPNASGIWGWPDQEDL